jgi:6-pyruvoyl-tetrahydropterin synthase
LKTTICHRETFNAAHKVDGDTFCGERVHGHDWFAEVVVQGIPDPKTGSITTRAPDLLFTSTMELHLKFANDMLPGLYSTPEGIAGWLFERLQLECPGLLSVTVGFTGHSATVEG